MAAPRRLTREKLLDVAADLFSEKGFDGTSITDITDALQITRPTLYAHAKSKADLLKGINERLLAFFKKNIAVFVREKDPPLKRIEGFVRLQLEATRYFPSTFRLAMRSTRDASLRHSVSLQEMWHRHDVVMLQAIEEGQKKKQITQAVQPKVLKHLVWGMLNEIPYWYRPFGPLSAEELTCQILSLLVGGAMDAPDAKDAEAHPVSCTAVLDVAREWRFEAVAVEEAAVTARAYVPEHSILHGSHQMTSAISGLAIWSCESHFRETGLPSSGNWSLQDLTLRFYPAASGDVMYCKAVRNITSQKMDIWDIVVTLEGCEEPLCMSRAVYGK